MGLEAVDYHADGARLKGYLARVPRFATGPGILVAHEAPGMNDHVRRRAEMLSELGYIAFALDLYGEEGFPLDQAMDRHLELMSTPGLLLKRAKAGLDVLVSQAGVDGTRLAAIGFCQGGITVLELARSGAPIRCAVGFHPGLTRPVGSPEGKIDAKVLMMIGDEDPVVPLEDRLAFAADMKAKDADWQLHVFGGVGHSFTNPAVDGLGRPGLAFNATADRRSWDMMLALLAESFGAASGARP